MTQLDRNLTTFLQIMQLAQSSHPLMILSGSTSLAFQSVEVEVHDIDIVTDKLGAKTLDTLLRSYCTKPLEYSSTGTYRSWYGKYRFNDCDIDIMGEFQYRLKDGTWSQPNHLHPLHHLDYHGASIPLLSLEQELQEYDNVGRLDKVAKIQAVLSRTI